MINLRRLQLRKYSRSEVDEIISKATTTIVGLVRPKRVIVFGSALSDQFDDHSDLDFVVILDAPEDVKRPRQALYRNGLLETRSCDFLCVDEAAFTRKSEFGGVYYVAATEGRSVFERSNPPTSL